MEPNNVERNLRSLRKLYSLLNSNARNENIPKAAYLLDENTQFLLKRLLDFASHELFVTQSEIIATQLGLFPRTDLHSLKSDSSTTVQINGSQNTQSSKPILEVKGPLKKDLRINQIQSNPSKCSLTEDVADAIERIDTQLSALSFVSNRVDSDDRTRSCKSPSLVTPIQKCQASMPGLICKSGSDRSHDDQLAVRSVSFKKPSNRTSQKMATMMDQETETESEQTSSWRSLDSEDEELVSTDQEQDETSRETGSSSGSNWETQAESDTESESDSSNPPQSSDDVESEVRSEDPPKQRRNVMGRFKRLKNKIGQVFHHHHHHHDDKNKPSAWKHLQKTFQQKVKSDETRKTRSESKGLTTHKQDRGGQFHALVEGLRRHRRSSKKQKNKLQSHGKKTHWWKRQGGGVKFPNRGRLKLGKKHDLSKTVHELEEN